LKILALSTDIPNAQKKGYQVVAYNRLIYLTNLGHSIKLICFKSKNKLDKEAKIILEKKGIEVVLIKFNFIEAILNLMQAIFFKELPFQCAFFKCKKFHNSIKEFLKKNNFDLIHIFSIRIMPNLSNYNCKLIVEMVDSLSLNFNRRQKLAKGIKKFILNIEQKRLLKYEKNIANQSTQTIVVSEKDKKMINSDKVKVIHLGTEIIKKRRNQCHNPKIVFSGNMFYQPNIDAIQWFVKYCWSKILKKNSTSMLFIIGDNPKWSLKRLEKKYASVFVTGRVHSMSDALSEATIAIAPMQSGSGMQFKILEAMALSIPVVTTTLGLGDLKAQINKEILIANNSDEFLTHINKLIQDKMYNLRIGKNGQSYVLKNHNWNNLNQKFLTSLDLK
tara:strand:+ start:1455 stop:2621 length:1167 start_codon:yes stop_codon:yes gene_type:complete